MYFIIKEDVRRGPQVSYPTPDHAAAEAEFAKTIFGDLTSAKLLSGDPVAGFVVLQEKIADDTMLDHKP